MPAIVTAAELRQILGVSSALYSDGYLDSILDASEQTILPLLTQYRSSVAAVEVRNEIIYFNTIRYNFFVPGQSVIVAGCVPDSYNGTYTVTDDRIEAFTFSAAKAGAADTTRAVPQIPGGTATLSGSSAADLYANVAAVQKALLVVAVEIFQSITAPGNQIMSDTFQPSPWVLGRSLQNRVMGLLAGYVDVETICQ